MFLVFWQINLTIICQFIFCITFRFHLQLSCIDLSPSMLFFCLYYFILLTLKLLIAELSIYKNFMKKNFNFPSRQQFLPVSKQDMLERGWEKCDFILVTGDAYVDHPSFANGIISRVLEAEGFRVGILSQPHWQDNQDIGKLGAPKLAFLVSAGNLDSLLSAYTANKLPRSEDPYSPGGKQGHRPNRATIVYCNLIRRTFGKIPIIIGGIEASQRRFVHYDYWEDKVRRSILLDSNADLLVFGMGEQQIIEIANRLKQGEKISNLTDIRGTCYVKKDIAFLHTPEYVTRFGEPQTTLAYEELLPPKGEEPQRIQESQPSKKPPLYRRNYAVAFQKIYHEQDPIRGRPIVQGSGALWVVQMPPPKLQTPEELDRYYALPYTRYYHPDYQDMGGVPAWETTQHSIVTHRGCLGSCSFCALTMHQGRIIQSRSVASIVKEAEKIVEMGSFCGYLSDVGGPTANMYANICPHQQCKGACEGRDCLIPKICPNLQQNLGKQLEMLSAVRKISGIKKAFISSGIRYDMLLDNQTAHELNDTYIENLAKHHTSGQLKVAPEHISDKVLERMHKPKFEQYEKFKKKFLEESRKAGKEQYLVAYFISSHPGCTMQEQIKLAEYFHKNAWDPEQVQDFIPTPMTPATAMFYSGYDPFTMDLVYTPTTVREKRRQRALMQCKKAEMQGRVRKALREAGRQDLIGYSKNSLVKPGPEEDWRD